MACRAGSARVVVVPPGGGVQAARRLFNQAECHCDDNLNFALRLGNRARCPTFKFPLMPHGTPKD
jgi:hypothetical protein